MPLSLNEIAEAHTNWMGPPLQILPFRRGSTGSAPDAVDIVIGGTAPEDIAKGEPPISVFATAGMSSRPLPGPFPEVELTLSVGASLDASDRATLARAMADMVLNIQDKKIALDPPFLLTEFDMPPFRQRSFLVCHTDLVQPERLGTAETQFVLMLVQPVYPEEMPLIEEIGPRAFQIHLDELGEAWDDPDRSIVTSLPPQ